MRIEQVDLNGNTEHATYHGVSVDEIVQVFANKPRISRNRKNRAAVYSAFGRTDGGRAIRVNFRYDASRWLVFFACRCPGPASRYRIMIM